MTRPDKIINNQELTSFFENIENIVGEWSNFESGSVWLAGIGSGSGKQVTLEVLQAITTADVIIHDLLIPHNILKFAKSNVNIINCGKRAGHHILRQKEICIELISLAKAKNKVLRLKGGDPTIFSRIGDEISSLVNAKIPYKILAGLSSVQCAAALLGIPLTHRMLSQSITFCTGSFAIEDSAKSNSHFNKICNCDSVSTLVLYMANRNIEYIASCLIKKGRKKNDPIAIISNIGSDNESVSFSNLKDISPLDKNFLPATFIIGEVVKLSPYFPGGYNKNI